MEEGYTTIAGPARAELKVSGSRFLAIAAPVGSKGDVDELLGRVKKEHFDASHHCYAYRIGPRHELYRYHDAGEPTGSAGKPILGAIERAGLTNIVVIVTRYFGGTKLGIGGLARAYGNIAESALSKAARQTRVQEVTLTISFPHAFVGGVMYSVEQAGARISETAYDEEVHLTLILPSSQADSFRSLLMEKTGGNVRIHGTEEH